MPANQYGAKFSVEVPEPGAGMGLRLEVTRTVTGRPDTDRVMAELNPLDAAVVTMRLPELPLATVSAVGDVLMEKSGLSPVTVRLTVPV